MNNWSILCPGPSLRRYIQFEADQGCIISVNSAILKCTADYWAIIDDETFESVLNKVGQTQLKVMIGDTTLWVPEKWQGRATRGKIRPIFWSFKRETFGNLPAEMDIGHGWRWNERTVFAAIALAIKKGARVIRIYGADMQGSGYCVKGVENKKMVHTPERWLEERILFEQAQAICKKNQIELIRMGI